MDNFYFLITFIILVVMMLIYGWYRFLIWRKKIKKETEDVEKTVNSAFENLKKKIEKEVEFMDKEPGLSREEKEIRDRLQEALDISGEIIKKEIEDVKKIID